MNCIDLTLPRKVGRHGRQAVNLWDESGRLRLVGAVANLGLLESRGSRQVIQCRGGGMEMRCLMVLTEKYCQCLSCATLGAN